MPRTNTFQTREMRRFMQDLFLMLSSSCCQVASWGKICSCCCLPSAAKWLLGGKHGIKLVKPWYLKNKYLKSKEKTALFATNFRSRTSNSKLVGKFLLYIHCNTIHAPVCCALHLVTGCCVRGISSLWSFYLLQLSISACFVFFVLSLLEAFNCTSACFGSREFNC